MKIETNLTYYMLCEDDNDILSAPSFAGVPYRNCNSDRALKKIRVVWTPYLMRIIAL